MPSKDILATHIKTIIDSSWIPSEMEKVLEGFQFKALGKGETLVKEGKICEYFCFIQHGILLHKFTSEGEEITTYLGLKNTFTTALESFKNRIKSRKSIVALSPCELWCMKVDSFNELLENNNSFRTFYYQLIEHQIFKIDDYRIDHLLLTPEERYQKLLSNEPVLLQQVPLHYLASFLGISTRHMSRIRKNLN